ncbi:beta-galactosidase [Demequina globuliformis]|uniref:beta-galactosidase n=1 Tax=Demequina globuliformis TaxID=676202 RepID=UPI000781A7FE|nr:beta-galactosidase [Demequina globuliformis]
MSHSTPPSAPAGAPWRGAIAYGCDYNPEQWPREVWELDADLMVEAGVTMVAVNIFGWAHINPADGVWDFEGLDAVLDLLHSRGIAVNLGTGTASTPPWLTTAHPEILPVMEDGTRRFPGGRQAWCPSSPEYRARSLDLVARVADRYGDHPAVALWHVSNELGCHNALCYCDHSAAAFREWLRERYATIDAVNDAWGTSFWSQRYGAFDEILPPLATVSSRNPSQVLDFHRFSSDALLAQYRAEQDVLRKKSSVPVTTNFMVTAHIRNLDYAQWAPHMDVIANDHYLDHRLADSEAEMHFSADLTRGLAGGEPWLLMETAVGAVNWQPLNSTRAPGELRRHVFSHVARGADGIHFFQWRASLQGSEKFHSAMLPHAGTQSRAWEEARDLGSELAAVGELAGTRTEAHAAIIFDWPSWWAVDGESVPSSHVRYLEQVHAAHAAMSAAGVTVDVVPATADLSRYSLVIAPAWHVVSDAAAGALDEYVQGGGHALVTFFSGVVDTHDRVRAGGYPGAFRDLLGVVVDEFAPLPQGDTVTLESGAQATLWSERVTLRGAMAQDSFVDGPMAGGAALTRHSYGAGTAWYCATALGPAAYADLARQLADQAQIPRIGGANARVTAVRRSGENGSYVVIANSSSQPACVDVRGTNLLTGQPWQPDTALASGDVAVVREEAA